MIKYNNEINLNKKDMEDIRQILHNSGMSAYCKECSEKSRTCSTSKTCCKKPLCPFDCKEDGYCKYLGKEGCENINKICLLFFCTQLIVSFPDGYQEITKIVKRRI